MISSPFTRGRAGFLLTSLLAVVLVFAGFRAVPQADGFIQQLVRQLGRFYAATFPEKSYLHLDKTTYAAGETVWLKAYVVQAGNHRPDTLSRVLYVDLLSPDQVLVRQQLLRLRNGTANGDILLPDTLVQGRYTVRAYTNWMRNTSPDYFYDQQITVWHTPLDAVAPAIGERRGRVANKPAAARLTVQFFPEGGNLVTGLESTIGFKAVDANGRGVDVAGTIKDSRGRDVVAFKSQHAGMGRFQLKPEPGQTYQATVRQSGGAFLTMPLPTALPTGFTMKVMELKDQIQVYIQRQGGTGTAAAEAITLVAHVRGQVAYAGQGQVGTGTTFSARIPKNRFSTGVAHFTLFDSQNQARCERLAFVGATTPDLRIALQPNKARYAPREKVTLRVAVTDAEGQPVAGQFSLAVNNAQLVPASMEQRTIRSYLLLTSELRGTVEDPGYYFANPTYNTNLALDNLMLTQGWRRFVWKELLANRFGNYPYPLEQSLSVSGQVMNGQLLGSKETPAANATVLLLRFGTENQLMTTTTDSLGRFFFGGFAEQDTSRLLVRVQPQKGLRNPIVRLDQKVAEGAKNLPVLPLKAGSAEEVAYLQSSKRQQVMERQYSPDGKRILLQNVDVRGRREISDGRRLYSRADAVIRTADVPAANSFINVLQLIQGRIAGVQVTGSPPDMSVTIRGASSIMGSNSPLFILDGVQTDASIVNSLPVQDVESVEVLKGPSAAIYGSRGGAGVIAIFTKRGNPNYDPSTDPYAAAPLGMATYALPRYYPTREFYQPPYQQAGAQLPPNDTRSATLFWVPQIVTDANGEATVTFYTSDIGGEYRLSLEGITNNGLPGTGYGTLVVTGK
ncbi:TonB-dependent receptor plug domain-containing protein [Hymenobacter aerilatus]|uniref:TonB-dependent receptor plug domain-containing protein n=1 Tax=Hymenobacter aerilatus TaxID=2932251 RepID=A0A8T9SY94_9BACT|nr:TonB-dependent receptor plug domain-containing protein [Hymenobacter aerilatus]UOR05170.1 TonB-dependent receptor plug domain-containing protein [Hymenobacter aerilatus]